MKALRASVTQNPRDFLIALSFLSILWIGGWLRWVDIEKYPALNHDEGMHTLEVHHFLDREPVNLWLPDRLANPFYSLAILPSELLFPPSAITLRLPVFLGGLCTVLLSFLLFSKFGKLPAILITGLVASSPMFIAYSRLAVETAYIPFATLPLLYFTLGKKWGWTLFFFVLSLIFHPTHVFLAPLLVFAALNSFLESKNARNKRIWLFFGIGTLCFLLFLNYLPPAILLFIQKNGKNLQNLPGFFLNWFRVLNGTQTYAGFSSPIPSAGSTILDSICAVLFISATSLLAFNFKKNREVVFLLLGFALSLLSFAWLGGESSLRPGRERYGWVLLTTVFVLYSFLFSKAAKTPRQRLGLVFATFGLCFFQLWGFWNFYIGDFRKTGGGNLPQTGLYRSAAVEPTAQVLYLAQKHYIPLSPKPLRLITEAGLITPLQYLTLNLPLIQVEGVPAEPARAQIWMEQALAECAVLVMRPSDWMAGVLESLSLPPLEKFYVADPEKLPILYLLRSKANHCVKQPMLGNWPPQ